MILGNIVAYRVRAKWALTTAAFVEAGASIAEDEGDYLSDVLDLGKLGLTVGAIWYGEALLGYAISNPVTGMVVGIIVIGAVVSYGIDGWTGLSNFGDFLSDIYNLDFGDLGDKLAFTSTALLNNAVYTIGQIGNAINERALEHGGRTREGWEPQPHGNPLVTNPDVPDYPYIPPVHPIVKLVNYLL